MNNKPEITMQQFLIGSAIVMVLVIALFCGAALILSSTGGSASEMPGRIWSWLFVDDVWFVPAMVGTVAFIYGWLKTYLPIWAKADRYYFTSVEEEKKEIKIATLAGKVVAFLGEDINDKTGKLEENGGTDYRRFFLFRHFGAIWIGYGSKVTKRIPAWNDLEYRVEKAETRNMPAVDFTVRINTRTIDTNITMGYGELDKAMREDSIELSNNLVKTYDIEVVLKTPFVFDMHKAEDATKPNWETVLKIDSLLSHKDGQKLQLMSLGDFEICDPNVKKALESEEIQLKQNMQLKLEAEGQAMVAEIKAKEAAAIELVKANADLAAEKIGAEKDKVKNAVELEKLQKEAGILGKSNAAELAKTRSWAEAIKLTNVQNLFLGGETAPSFLMSGEGKAKK